MSSTPKGNMPVSYTHLDVYKRQMYAMSKVRRENIVDALKNENL